MFEVKKDLEIPAKGAFGAGRPKSPIRIAAETLEVGDSLLTDEGSSQLYNIRRALVRDNPDRRYEIGRIEDGRHGLWRVN